MKRYVSYKASGVPWLGEVPSHWEVKQTRFVMTCNDEVLPEHTSAEQPLDYIEISDVDEISGIKRFETIVFGSAPSRARRLVAEGDIIVSTVRTYLRAVAAIVNPTPNTVVSTGFAVLRPNKIASRYAKYAILYDGFISEVIARSKGISYPAINAPDLVRISIPVPPSDEQQAIADYLDAETARIDTLVQEKEGLIGLLREWRQSVISEYTSGANQPQDKKATGNVHMPRIPSSWAMVRLGKYARIGNGSTPLKDNASYWEQGDFPWLNSAVVNQDEVWEGSEHVTPVALQACHLPIVEPGALLVALTGQGKTRGQVTVLRIQATINQHLAYLALDSEHFDSGYVFWTLTGMYAALRMVSDGQGGTKGALTCEDLSRFQIPMPLLAEQREIAAALAAETAKIDTLITHTQEAIALLKELRAATIADAVLGRVDVRQTLLKQ